MENLITNDITKTFKQSNVKSKKFKKILQKIIGEELREIRKIKKIKSKDVAKVIKTTPTTMTFWETGKNPVALNILIELLSLYNVDFVEFIKKINEKIYYKICK